jgi:N-dimethylarginine dimethylaminohydrolase
MIIMLNLLIAIISETFAKVNSNVRQAVFQEKASMIAENAIFISDSARTNYAAKNKLILVITDLEKVEEFFDDPVMVQISRLSEFT